jgi:ribose transport system substrate-binding protein
MRFELFARRVSVSTLALCAAVLSACGGGTKTDAGKTSGPDAATAAASAAERLPAYYRGTFGKPPTTSPTPVPGKSIAIVSLTELSSTIHLLTSQAEEAARAMGWQTTVIDGAITTQGWNRAVRAATSKGVDAIVLAAIECAPVRAALEAAKANGIVIFGVIGADCDDPSVGGEALFDGFEAGGKSTDAVLNDTARMRADWLIAAADGKATTLTMDETDYVAVQRLNKATNDWMAEHCGECSSVSVNFVLADVGTPFKNKVQSGLLRNPGTNSVAFPYDVLLTLGGGAAAVQGAGRELNVMGGECGPPNLELIRQGTQDACVGTPYGWLGWAAIDGLNRVFQGEATVDSGAGVQLVDEDHNMPDDNVYDGPGIDYKSAYKQAWGLR